MAENQKLLPPQQHGKGRPRANLRQVINAIFYLQKAGCQWRMLPVNFPKWQTVYGWFRKWTADGTWQQIHDLLVQQVREKAGKKPQPTVGIIDSQSVKSTAHAGVRGYDAGKKVNGRKRHMVVDSLGLIWSLAVTPADVREEDGACLVLCDLPEKAPGMKTVYADSAYKRNKLPQWIQQTLGIKVEIVRKIARGFEVLPKRWIVERTFGWLNNDRRLSKDVEITTESSESMIYLGQIRRMLNRLVVDAT